MGEGLNKQKIKIGFILIYMVFIINLSKYQETLVSTILEIKILIKYYFHDEDDDDDNDDINNENNNK
jgi:hypothetical protein